MTEQLQIHSDSWFSFQQDKFFKENFIKQHFLDVELTKKSSKGSFFRLKQSFKKKSEDLVNKQEILTFIPFQIGSLILKGGRENFQIQTTLKNLSFSHNHEGFIYGKLQTQRNFQKKIWEIGVKTSNKDFSHMQRFTFNQLKQSFEFTSKAEWSFENNLNLSYLLAENISSNFFNKFALQLGYTGFMNKQLNIKLYNDKWFVTPCKSIFQLIRFVSIKGRYQKESYQAAVEMKWNMNGKFQQLLAGIQWKFFNDKGLVKAKISSKRQFGLSVLNPIGSFGSYLFGCTWKNIGTSNNIFYGMKIIIND